MANVLNRFVFPFISSVSDWELFIQLCGAVFRTLRLTVVSEITNIIPWVTVESLFESILVEVVSNESNAPTQNEQSIEAAIFDHFIGFMMSEGATAPQHIHEAHRNCTINIQNQICFLLRCHLLDSKRKVEDCIV